MAIFPQIKTESIVQTDDMTRLFAGDSFATQDEPAVSNVEIEPESGAGFISVFNANKKNWFLDWSYAGVSRTVTATVRVTTDGSPVSKTVDFDIITPADDLLFSDDGDLLALENEVLNYVPGGRTSWLNVHRKAQEIILGEIDERGIQNTDGSRITKDQIIEVDDVKRWSTYLALAIIFENISNEPGDTFALKAAGFTDSARFHAERSFLRIDFNKDGTATKGEQEPVRSSRLIRQ